MQNFTLSIFHFLKVGFTLKKYIRKACNQLGCNYIVSLIAKFEMDLSLLDFNEPDLSGK